MNMHEYMLLADGTVLYFPKGLPAAHQIADALIEHKGIAYYWPGSQSAVNMEGVWYSIIPVFEYPGGTPLGAEELPDVIKLAVMLT